MWKTINKYPKYEVSDYGDVRIIKNKKLLKKSVDSRGYYKVTLINENGRKTLFVHRLVAMEFIQNQSNLSQVNHIDENKQNNHISNLEWCDLAYNCNYGTRNQRISEANKGRTFSEEHIKKLSESQIGEKNNMYGKRYEKSPRAIAVVCVESRQEYLSCKEASEKTGISRTSLCNCLRGNSKTAGGFHWRYI